MKKLKINSKTIKTAIYTIAILITIGFAVYPTTNSYFLKKADSSIAYTSALNTNKLSGITDATLNPNSNIDTIRITLDLKRDIRYPNETDEYILEIQNHDYPSAVCSIVSDSKQDINITNGKITFNSNKNTGKIDIECDIKDNIRNKHNINIDVKMYEIINNENKIIYGKVTHTETYTNYFNRYGTIIQINNPDGTPKTDNNAVFNEFIELLVKHYKTLSEPGKDTFVNNYNVPYQKFSYYVYDQFNITENEDHQLIVNDGLNILFNANPFPIKGITRTEVTDAQNKLIGYAYSFEDSLTGYAKTYDWYENPNSDGNRLYLSTTDSDFIKEEIEYFLNKYDLTAGTKLFNYIDAYITNKFSGKYSIENLESIPGIYYISSGDETGYPFITNDIIAIDLANNYLDIIEALKNGSDTITIKVNHYDDNDLMKKIFSHGASTAYNKTYEEIYNKIDSNGALYAALTCKENCHNYQELYYDYNTKDKYYDINITPKDGYNEVKITTIPISTTNPITGSAQLNAALTCKKDCTYNREVHYSNNTYTDYRISQYNNEANRIVITTSDTNPINGSDNIDVNIKQNTSYGETHYDGTSFYLVQVKPAVDSNPVIVTFDYKGTTSPFGGSPLLDKALKCQDSKTCQLYKELRYINGTYYFVDVIPKDTNVVILYGRAGTDIKKAFNESLGYNIESINLSLSSENYLGSIPNGTDIYNEIHYDGENYLLVKVKDYNGQKIITVSKLWSPTISEENETTIEQMINDYNSSKVYFYHVADLEHMKNTLEKYLEKRFKWSIRTVDSSADMPNYESGYYRLTSILP